MNYPTHQYLGQQLKSVSSNFPYNISLFEVSHRGAVSTLFKVFGMTQPKIDLNPEPPISFSEQTLDHYHWVKGQTHIYESLL